MLRASSFFSCGARMSSALPSFSASPLLATSFLLSASPTHAHSPLHLPYSVRSWVCKTDKRPKHPGAKWESNDHRDAIIEARQQVFGYRPDLQKRGTTAINTLNRKIMGPLYADYYLPPPPRAWNPQYIYRAEKRERLKRKGKSAPKKGMGKRAMRKK